MVHMPAAVFTNKEVKEFLEIDGYLPDTPEFENERRRRYLPHGEGWTERDDWLGDRRQNDKVA